MKGKGGKARVRIVKANPMVMYKAYDLLLERSADDAEAYLREKGLIGVDEMLYSAETRITDRSAGAVGFSVIPSSFGVARKADW